MKRFLLATTLSVLPAGTVQAATITEDFTLNSNDYVDGTGTVTYQEDIFTNRNDPNDYDLSDDYPYVGDGQRLHMVESAEISLGGYSWNSETDWLGAEDARLLYSPERDDVATISKSKGYLSNDLWDFTRERNNYSTYTSLTITDDGTFEARNYNQSPSLIASGTQSLTGEAATVPEPSTYAGIVFTASSLIGLKLKQLRRKA